MSMLGKISVGMVRIEIPPRMAIRIDITTNVYGRRSASRTIHIMLNSYLAYDDGWRSVVPGKFVVVTVGSAKRSGWPWQSVLGAPRLPVGAHLRYVLHAIITPCATLLKHG